MVSKKLRLILSLSFIAVLTVGIIVCSIVDAAISGSLTWSLYPISSCIFAGCVMFPALFSGKRGILTSMIMLTILIIPYLFVLDRIAGTDGLILRVGAVSAVIALAYLWSVFFIMKRFKSRKLLGGGISAILAAPVCIIINCSLSFLITPEAGIFNVWDILDIIILTASGLLMICFDLIIRKHSRPR